MKRANAAIVLALLLAATIAAPFVYTYLTAPDAAPAATGSEAAPGDAPAPGTGVPGAVPEAGAPGGSDTLGGADGPAAVHNTTPQDLNSTPLIPLWMLPVDDLGGELGAIARYLRGFGEYQQNVTRDDANENYSRIRDLLSPFEVNATALLLNDTVEDLAASLNLWTTYRTVTIPRASGPTFVETNESLWHVQGPGYAKSTGAWVAGAAGLGAVTPGMNDSLVSPWIDLSGVEGASGATPTPVRRNELPSTTLEPIVNDVIPAGSTVPPRSYPYGVGLVNLTFLHRFNFGTLGEDGAVVEVQTLYPNGTLSSWKPLLHSARDQVEGYAYSSGESAVDKVNDPSAMPEVLALGTPGYTRTSVGDEFNWTADRFDMSDHVGETVRFRLRVATRDFGFSADDLEEFPERRFFGWWVDDLRVTATVRTLDAAVSSVLSPRPGDVLVPGDMVNVTALVTNVGGSHLERVTVRLSVNGVNASEAYVTLPAQRMARVELPFRVPAEGVHTLNVTAKATLGTGGVYLIPTGDLNPSNDFVAFPVRSARVVDAGLVEGSLKVDPREGDEHAPRTISVTLENAGNVPVEGLNLTLEVVDASTGLPAGEPVLLRIGNHTATEEGEPANLTGLPPGKRLTSLGDDSGTVEVAWGWRAPGPGVYNATVRLNVTGSLDGNATNDLLPRAGERFQFRIRATPPSFLGPITFENQSHLDSVIDRAGVRRNETWRAFYPASDSAGEGSVFVRSTGATLSAEGIPTLGSPSRVAATTGIPVSWFTAANVTRGESLWLEFLSREDAFNPPGAAPAHDVGIVEAFVSRDVSQGATGDLPTRRELLEGSVGGGSSRVPLASYVNTGATGWQARALNVTELAARAGSLYFVFNHTPPSSPEETGVSYEPSTWSLDGYRLVLRRGNETQQMWPNPARAPASENGCDATPNGDFLAFTPSWTCVTVTVPSQWRVNTTFGGPGPFNRATLQWYPGKLEWVETPVVDLTNASDPWMFFDQFVDLNPAPFESLRGGRIPITTANPVLARATVQVQAYDEANGTWSDWRKIYPAGGYNAGNTGPADCLAAPFDDEPDGPYDDYASDDNSFISLNGPWSRIGFNLSSQPHFPTPVTENRQCPAAPERLSYVGKVVRFRIGVIGPDVPTVGGDPITGFPVAGLSPRGMFVDNLVVRERYFANDVGIATDAPDPLLVGNGGTVVGQGASVSLSVKVRNFGRYDQAGVPVEVRIEEIDDEGAPVRVVYEDVVASSPVPGLQAPTDYTVVDLPVRWIVPACDGCEGLRYRVSARTLLNQSDVPARDDDPSNDLAILELRVETKRDLSLSGVTLTPARAEQGAPRTIAFTVENGGNVDVQRGVSATLTVSKRDGSGAGIPVKTWTLPAEARIAFGRSTTPPAFQITSAEAAGLAPGKYVATLVLEGPPGFDMVPENNRVTLVFEVLANTAFWSLTGDATEGFESLGRWLLGAGGLDGKGAARYSDTATGEGIEALLRSPPVSVGGVARAFITLVHNYSFEPGFDGGIVEVRLRDEPRADPEAGWGPWLPVEPVGGYPGVVGSGTPLGPATSPAFTGSSADLGSDRYVNSTFEVTGPGLASPVTILGSTFDSLNTLTLRLQNASRAAPGNEVKTSLTVRLTDPATGESQTVTTASGSAVLSNLLGGTYRLNVTGAGYVPFERLVDLPLDGGIARFLPVDLTPCGGPAPACPAPGAPVETTRVTGWTVKADPIMTAPPGGSAYHAADRDANLTYRFHPANLVALVQNGTLQFRDWRQLEFVGVGNLVGSIRGESFNDKALVRVTYCKPDPVNASLCLQTEATLEDVSANTSTRYADYYDETWPLREANLTSYLAEHLGFLANKSEADWVNHTFNLTFELNATADDLAANAGWAIADVRLNGVPAADLAQQVDGVFQSIAGIPANTRWRFVPPTTQAGSRTSGILGQGDVEYEGGFAFLDQAVVQGLGGKETQFGHASRNSESTLESPALDLSNYVGDVTLTVRHKYQFENVRPQGSARVFNSNGGRVELQYVDDLGNTHTVPLEPVGGYPDTLFSNAYSAEDSTLGGPFGPDDRLWSGGALGSFNRTGHRNGWVTDTFDLTPYKGYRDLRVLFHAWHGGNANLDPVLKGRMGWIVGDVQVSGHRFSASEMQVRFRALADATLGGNHWEIDTVRVLGDAYQRDVSLRLDPALDGLAVQKGVLPETPFTSGLGVTNPVGFEVAHRGAGPATVRVALTVTSDDGTAPYSPPPMERVLQSGEAWRGAFTWAPPSPDAASGNATIRAKAYVVAPGTGSDDNLPYRPTDALATNDLATATVTIHRAALEQVAAGTIRVPTTGDPGAIPREVPLHVGARLTGTEPALANFTITIRNATYRHEAIAQVALAWPAGEGEAVYRWTPPEGAAGVYQVYANLSERQAHPEAGSAEGRIHLGGLAMAFRDDFETIDFENGTWTASGWDYNATGDARSGEWMYTSLRRVTGGGTNPEAARLERTNVDLRGVSDPVLTFAARYAYPEQDAEHFGARFEIREVDLLRPTTWQPLTLSTPYNERFETLSSAPDVSAFRTMPILTGRTPDWVVLQADLARQQDVNGTPVSYAGKIVEIRMLNLLGATLPVGEWGIQVDDVAISSYRIALSPGPQEHAVQDGTLKRFAFRVENRGSVTDRVNVTLDLAPDVPSEWRLGFCAATCDTLAPYRNVTLAPGESYEGIVVADMGLSPFPGTSMPRFDIVAASLGDPNQVLRAPVTFRLRADRHADLIVAEVVPGSPSVTLGEAVPVTVFVRNQGSAATPAGAVTVRLFDNGRPLDTITLPAPVKPDPFNLRTNWVAASFTWRPLEVGDHALVAVVNPDRQVEELDYGNNEAQLPFIPASAAPAPDVSVAAVSIAPEEPLSGTLAEVTVLLRNRGNVEAGRVRVEVRAGSFLVGAVEGLTVPVGGAEQLTFPWRVIAGGDTLTVFAAGDAADANPSDNQASRPLRIRNIAPRIEAAPGEQALVAGAENRVEVTVRNAGTTPSLLNLDLALPAGWTGRLGTTQVGPLAGNETATAEVFLRPPADATAGTYPVRLKAIARSAPAASIEVSVPVAIPAMREIRVEALPAEADPGAPTLVPLVLTNLGNAPEEVRLRTVPEGLVPAGLDAVLLAPFETRRVDVPFTIPAATAPGAFAYRVFAEAADVQDSANATVEVRRAYVPRLTLEGARELEPGQENTMTLHFRNEGNAPGTTHVAAALEAAGSPLIVSPDIVSIAPGESATITVRASVPHTLTAPLLIEALSYEGAPRLDPADSARLRRDVEVIPVSGRIPDLRVLSVEHSPRFNIQAGEMVTYTVTIENAGAGDAVATTAGLFLDAALASEASVPAIPAGGRATFTVAAPAPAGTHFATVVLDLPGILPEARREDNALALKLEASGGVPGGTAAATSGNEVPGLGAPLHVLAIALAFLALTARRARRRTQ